MSTHLACILRMRMSAHRCVWVRISLVSRGCVWVRIYAFKYASITSTRGLPVKITSTRGCVQVRIHAYEYASITSTCGLPASRCNPTCCISTWHCTVEIQTCEMKPVLNETISFFVAVNLFYWQNKTKWVYKYPSFLHWWHIEQKINVLTILSKGQQYCPQVQFQASKIYKSHN